MASSYASFNPAYGQAINVATAASSASGTVGLGAENLVVTNNSTEVIYFRTGKGSATATQADYCLKVDQQVSISKARDHDTVAVLGTGANGNVHFIPGKGI